MIANGTGYRSGERLQAIPVVPQRVSVLGVAQLLLAGSMLAMTMGQIAVVMEIRSERQALESQRSREVQQAVTLEQAHRQLAKQVAELLLKTRGN